MIYRQQKIRELKNAQQQKVKNLSQDNIKKRLQNQLTADMKLKKINQKITKAKIMKKIGLHKDKSMDKFTEESSLLHPRQGSPSDAYSLNKDEQTRSKSSIQQMNLSALGKSKQLSRNASSALRSQAGGHKSLPMMRTAN